MDTSSNKLRLKRLLDELKWIIECPKIFLFDHFSNLINKIDFAAARQSQNIKNIRSNENLIKINQVWNRMFNLIKSFELECFESLNSRLVNNSFTELIQSEQTDQSIRFIEKSLKRFKELTSQEVENVEELLYQETNRIKRALFLNKCLIFFDRQHQQKDILIFNKMKNNIFFEDILTNFNLVKLYRFIPELKKLNFSAKFYSHPVKLQKEVKHGILLETFWKYSSILIKALCKFYFGTSFTKKFNNELLKAWFLAKKIKENLTNNSISEMSIANLYKIDTIDLSYQKLNIISKDCFDGLYNLRLLNLGDNRITKIEPGSFDNLLNINEIILSNNQLKSLDSNLFHNVTSVKKLILNKNSFSNLNKELFYNLIHLEYLDISHNQLKSIDQDQFIDLKNLIEIDLSANKLKTVNTYIFKGLTKLQKIWLNYNRLNVDKLEIYLEESVKFISFKRRLFGNDVNSINLPFT